jgi:hypothetical protein
MTPATVTSPWLNSAPIPCAARPRYASGAQRAKAVTAPLPITVIPPPRVQPCVSTRSSVDPTVGKICAVPPSPMAPTGVSRWPTRDMSPSRLEMAIKPPVLPSALMRFLQLYTFPGVPAEPCRPATSNAAGGQMQARAVQ